MRKFLLKKGTAVRLISPTGEDEERKLSADTVFFEDDLVGEPRRVVIESDELGFWLADGWGSASHGLLIVKATDVEEE